MSQETKKKKSTSMILSIVLLILILVLGIAFVFQLKNKQNAAVGNSGRIDAEASDWDTNLNAPSEIQGQILVPGYSGATIAAGDKTLSLRIGNPAENNCYLQATLQLADGTVLFESDLLEPGKGYEKIELSQTLQPGSYDAMVHYQGYSMDEEPQMLNSCDSGFVLTVTE